LYFLSVISIPNKNTLPSAFTEKPRTVELDLVELVHPFCHSMNSVGGKGHVIPSILESLFKKVLNGWLGFPAAQHSKIATPFRIIALEELLNATFVFLGKGFHQDHEGIGFALDGLVVTVTA
jgi:hypothetical protein